MITIARGSQGSLESHVAALVRDEGGLVVRASGDPRAPVPYGLLRAIVASVRAKVGDAHVERALGPERVALSLVLRGLAAELDDDGLRERAAIGGLARGALPNVVLSDRVLYWAWHAAMIPLLAGQRVAIVASEVDAIDLESLVAMRLLVRALRDRGELRVVVGHDPSLVPSESVDGLLRSRRLGELAMLEALHVTRVEIVSGDAPRPPPRPAPARDRLDDGLESRAFAALRAGGPDARALALDALRASFDAYGFDAALRLADAITTGAEDDAVAREADRLGALALHNLAPLSKEAWIGDRLVRSFERLVAAERDPIARAHWGYRLGMAHGRTRGAVEAAIRSADGAVADVTSAPDAPRAPFVEAWTRNGRAYARARAEDFAGAAADCEAGLARIARAVEGVPDAEVGVTRVLLANNRSRVAQSAGDLEALARWREVTRAHLEALAPHDRPGASWFLPPDDERDLAASKRHYEAMLAEARDRLDPETEAVAAHGLGVALYKIGDAAGAYDAFATSLRIWRITRGFAEDLLTEELNCAVTAFRAGKLDAAEEGFARVRSNPLMDDDAPQAETLAALAMIDAKGGDVARATSRADEAVRAADAGCDADVRVRVLRSSAEACLLAADRAGARARIDRALATIAEVEGEGGELPPEDVLGALITALEARDAHDESLLRRALTLAPGALGDANAWWDLPRLVARLASSGELARDPELAGALAAIDVAARQRIDVAR